LEHAGHTARVSKVFHMKPQAHSQRERTSGTQPHLGGIDDRGGIEGARVTAQAAATAKKRSEAALDLGRVAEAIKYAREAVAAAPDDAEAFCALADALLASGDDNGALDAAEKGTALAPGLGWAHACRAIALLKLGEHSRALEAIDEALRIDPGMAARHRIRARVLAKLGRAEEARKEAQRACELSPGDATSHDLVALYAFKDRRWPEAERSWREALRIDPMNALRLNNFGAALDRQGRGEEARQAYRRAIQMDPSLAVSKRNLHETVRFPLKRATLFVVVGAVALVKLALRKLGGPSLAPRLAATTTGSVALGVFVIVTAAGLAWLARRVWAKRLAARDPELMRLYRQIDADIAAGRLRKPPSPWSRQ
jgi:tetratricopeptide (TPR) repeat protein